MFQFDDVVYNVDVSYVNTCVTPIPVTDIHFVNLGKINFYRKSFTHISLGNYSQTSDIFRAFVAHVRTKLNVFCQTVHAIIRVAMRATKTGLSTRSVRGSQLSVHVLLLAWQHVSLIY